ncbi:MAG: tripartite tricarboxylate transporter substrate binding protein [Candidatus Vecturithrix sp.]|jgi:tripartite-type tricarboxylate transporter receptor subunit TctC|nr:tripartite tricarboxylate transporter substrate binding protein [Candidatus Vecturithrix sp.]
MMKKITIILALTGLFVSLLAVTSFAAAPYPNKEITIVVPHSPGGGTDTTTRFLAKVMEKYAGVPVVVINKTGAGGAVGMAYAMNSQPDGYTVAVPTVEVTTLPHLGLAPFTIEDFAPAALVTNIPSAIAVNVESEFQTFQELIDYAKANPMKVRTGNSGTGAIWHMVALGLEDVTGVKFTHVPFDGGAPAATALLGGHIEMVTIGQGEVFPHYEAGKLRALAVTSTKPLANYPGVPTLQELGVDLPPLGGWISLAFPVKTDPEIVQKFSSLVKQAMDDPEFQEFLNNRAYTNDYMDPAGTTAFWKEQSDFFKNLIEKFGLKK